MALAVQGDTWYYEKLMWRKKVFKCTCHESITASVINIILIELMAMKLQDCDPEQEFWTHQQELLVIASTTSLFSLPHY